jgi:hypothetical protein
MILSLLVPPGAGVAADDLARLAAQFGLTADKVDAMASRVLGAVRAAGDTLERCQPKDASRCPHCARVLPG